MLMLLVDARILIVESNTFEDNLVVYEVKDKKNSRN